MCVLACILLALISIAHIFRMLVFFFFFCILITEAKVNFVIKQPLKPVKKLKLYVCVCVRVYAMCTHCATCPIQNGDSFCLHSSAKNIVRKQKQNQKQSNAKSTKKKSKQRRLHHRFYSAEKTRKKKKNKNCKPNALRQSKQPALPNE